MNDGNTGTTPGPPRASMSGIFGPIPARRPTVPDPDPPRWRLPLALFMATCLSTWLTNGPLYALGVMGILSVHEMGHYLQARRYRIPASLPYFIPLPVISLTGTLGAVIGMRPRSADPKRLYDIAITGPLAGLVPSLALSYYGLQLSTITPTATDSTQTIGLGEPPIFRLLSLWVHGPLPEGQDVLLHPLAFAGWVGIFITALNLLPIGQLDGGHILYALLRRRARYISRALLAIAAGFVTFDAIRAMQGAGEGYWAWWLMVLLLTLIGVDHPPTANDSLVLDRKRQVLGWLTLLFFPLGFTPIPFIF